RSSGALHDNTRALFCHVLAGFGRPEHGWMARLSEIREKLDMAGRANLAAAWFCSGRKDRARTVLSEDMLEMPVVSSTGGRITSKLRQEAVLLLVLLDIDPKSVSIPTLARRINDARKKRGYWGSTLENATALAALSRYQMLVRAQAKYTGSATLPGGGELAFDSASPAVREFKDTGEPIEVASEGRGTLYVSVTTEGLAVGRSVPEYDRRLRVRRRWTDSDGKTIDPTKLNVGDLVRVETTLSAPGLGRRGTVYNVAIVDALPGGMEVENPRLATSAHAGNDGARAADHVEFLDDRVVIFTSIGRHARTFRYCVRAITEGEFALPPVQASCMYDAAYASVNGAGRIKVGRHQPDRGDASQAEPNAAKPKPASPGEGPPPADPRPVPAPDPAPTEVEEPLVPLSLAATAEMETVE
ncbi:MAG: alpha-2-macroglobulin family protein, partial [Planctomycetota bacterium]